MTIIDKIKRSVESATGLAFLYDTPQTLNQRLDNMLLPCAMMQIVESGAVADENGIIRERLSVMVLFADKTDIDFDGVQNEREHLDAMKKAAFRWLLALRRDDDLRFIEGGGTTRYYADNDAIVTAYGVQVTIEETEGVCYGTTATTDSDTCGCA